MYNNALLGAGDAMSLRKAAEMGLEALEANLGKWAAKTPAIEALRQALAQPEQEPVCFLRETAWSYEIAPWDYPNGFPVYTAPPKREWVGLTEADIYELLDNEDEFDFAKTIEAKLKEKNSV